MYDIKSVWKDWEIVRFIGEGSFGKVYEIARNKFGIEEHSALKVITIPTSSAEVQSFRNEGMDDESVTSYYRGLVDDFVQEIGIMAKLKGKSGIVSYEDYEVIPHTDNVGWDILIRMELLTPFTDFIRDHRFNDNDVVKIGLDLCDALIVCHNNGIMHRDIKFDNIFISDETYKLGDFGVARTIEKTASGLSKKGTYTYMAPEVYKGEPYGIDADIYSLGMVMYKLLNYNREPFMPLPPESITYNDKSQALAKRMNGEPMTAPANAREELSKIILKACAYLPEDRYNSAQQLKNDLLQYKIAAEAEVQKTYGETVVLNQNDFIDYDKTIIIDDLSLNSENKEILVDAVTNEESEKEQLQQDIQSEDVVTHNTDSNDSFIQSKLNKDTDNDTKSQLFFDSEGIKNETEKKINEAFEIEKKKYYVIGVVAVLVIVLVGIVLIKNLMGTTTQVKSVYSYDDEASIYSVRLLNDGYNYGDNIKGEGLVLVGNLSYDFDLSSTYNSAIATIENENHNYGDTYIELWNIYDGANFMIDVVDYIEPGVYTCTITHDITGHGTYQFFFVFEV